MRLFGIEMMINNDKERIAQMLPESSSISMRGEKWDNSFDRSRIF